MLLYALIGLSLVLVGLAGLQFTYLFYVDRLDRERKKRVRELELMCRELTKRLEHAESQLAMQKDLIEAITGSDEENWADVIEER